MSPRVLSAQALRVLVGLCALAVLVAGCSDGNGRGATATDTADTAGTASTDVVGAPGSDEATDAAASLDWRSCDDGFECATLQVPLDYNKPDDRTIGIGIARRPTKNQDRKVGTLFVNPGGPGASAIDFLEGGGFPQELTDRFDLAAIDPRGVGRSAPVECGFDPTQLYRPDPTMEDQSDRAEYIRVAQSYVDQCEAKGGDLLPYVGTRNTVRDMDQVRKAMGEDKLNFLGLSYGTVIGATYADLFPDKVRAIVLDGVVDLSKPGIQGAEFQASGFETALRNWAADCRSRTTCPAGPDPIGLFERVEAETEQAPIPAPGADRSAGPGEFALGTAEAMYSQGIWPVLSQALADAKRGDGTGMVKLANRYLRVPGGGRPSSQFDGYFAIGCLDVDYPRDPQAILDAGDQADVTYPHFGEAIVNDYARCGLWPVPSDPIEPPKATGSPPILVVGTTGDPATPYQASVDMARILPRGVLVSYQGEGHVAFGTSHCATGAEVSYLVDLKVPDHDPMCTT